MKVLVGSKNPTKVNATLKAFQEVFDTKIEIEGRSVASGVSDQPMGNDETLQGALNRMKGLESQFTADFYVGLEGGIIKHSKHEMEAMAWMTVTNGTTVGKARTAGFFLAPKTIELIEQGLELGHADEQVFQITNSKQKMGSSGLLTNNIITRERFYIDAIILALIPFIRPNLFNDH